jgi:succinate dehydrogenase/fumarate reductase cytochrome b subunit
MFKLITLVFHFAYGFRHFFSLMKKSNQKKSRLCQNPPFCLVVTAEAKKTRPFTVQMAYALLCTVGLKHFFAFTAFTPAKSGF